MSDTLTRIPEIIIPGKRLGRHVDRRVPLVRAAGGPPPLSGVLKSVLHASGPGMPLNQGDTGSCTANALSGALNTIPHWSSGKPTLDETAALQVYSLEEKDLTGTGYPPTDDGGSGVAVCEAAITLGWCSDYQVADGIQEALLALVLRPVIVGINWFTSFDTPSGTDSLVAIAPGATVRGGHEVLATQLIVPEGVTIENLTASLDQILVGFWNSWGTDWGTGGRFTMTAATLQQLLADGGDVAVPRTGPGWIFSPPTN